MPTLKEIRDSDPYGESGQDPRIVNGVPGIEQPVQVYVRKGADNDQRCLSFCIPEWLSQGEVLDKGWAIDGNQVLVLVAKTELRSIEVQLVEWFRQKGHGITFC